MVHKIITTLLVFNFLLVCNIQAQTTTAIPKEKDEIISMPFVGFSAGFILPGGEMGKMYNPFFSFGASFLYKTNQNWLYGLDVDFMLGADNLKDEKKLEILSGITSPEGSVIGITGTDAGVTAELQAISAIVKIGKIIPVSQKNRNSGIYLSVGGGYLQQRILFDATLEDAPQIQDDYAKGYDCLRRGFQLREFIGYMHVSNNNRFVNFYAGIEFTQAWSTSARDYVFFEHKKDEKSYFDLMYTIKAGWIFSLKSKKAKDFYYY